jgi:hypothetical protein
MTGRWDESPRCSASKDGRRCELLFNHGSYHAAKVGNLWVEWFSGQVSR